MLITDVILLSIMLAGLLRLRMGGGGSFYLSQLLWKQVGHYRFLLVVMFCLTAFDVLQGVIWLAIATAAEVPQVVSMTSFIIVHARFLYLSQFYSVVVPLFECER